MRIALPLILIAALAVPAFADDAANTSDPLPPKDVQFTFQGPFGLYDRAGHSAEMSTPPRWNTFCGSCEPR